MAAAAGPYTGCCRAACAGYGQCGAILYNERETYREKNVDFPG
nr:MAG TPA: hypothetical protein [Caudoviricetes sp.]